MSVTMLFYKKITPIKKERHSDISIEMGQDYSFANRINSVPVTTVEFRKLVSEYPILFTQAGEDIVPVVALGLKTNQNLYLDDSGNWNASYVPAFVRRYPFIFITSNESKEFTLCIDEAYEGCNREDRGEKLYTANGERTPFLKNNLEFVHSYQNEHRRTTAFCNSLKQLGLLESMQANFSLAKGGETAITGFLGINRERLKALDGEVLKKLVQVDGMELIYLHLQSLSQFDALAKRDRAE
jgi:hypothetical protein